MTDKRTLSQHPDVTAACARRPETTRSKKGPRDLHRLRGRLPKGRAALN